MQLSDYDASCEMVCVEAGRIEEREGVVIATVMLK
jgi:hypothetical protein